MFWGKYLLHKPITVAPRSEAWSLFASSNTATVGSNPTRGMDICIVCVYSVCIVCVGSGLATGWSSVQVVPPTAYRIKTLKKRPRSKGLQSRRGIEKNLLHFPNPQFIVFIPLQLHYTDCRTIRGIPDFNTGQTRSSERYSRFLLREFRLRIWSRWQNSAVSLTEKDTNRLFINSFTVRHGHGTLRFMPTTITYLQPTPCFLLVCDFFSAPSVSQAVTIEWNGRIII
jgi:hypothetical protein